MIRIIDASIVAKLLFPEEDTEAARRLLEGSDTVLAPEIIVAESCNIGWLKHRRGLATADQAEDVPAQVCRIVDQLVPTDGLAASAVRIALALDHPVYDCFYLALAELGGHELVTADRRFASVVSRSRWRDRLRILGGTS